ncbi:MAG: hypothetical protein HYZ01_13790 [Ignavibacteriales bacterium]|nr:hypothetical protein [Ignavibacteriales bacterium]
MNHAHEALRTLLGTVPLAELSNDQQRTTFEALRQRLVSVADLETELRSLYKVRNFSDFATTLLWIANRTEKEGGFQVDPGDTYLVLSSFRAAMGGVVPPSALQAPAPDAGDPFAAFGVGGTEQSTLEEHPSSLEGFFPETPSNQQEPPGTPTVSGDEKEFSALLEQFVEAMQSGEDARITLLERVVAVCSLVGTGEFADDYKEYCRYLSEFLSYISENQYLDDVRVMNILSNVSSPVSQWANTAPTERQGVLEEGIAPLRDFKSLFE